MLNKAHVIKTPQKQRHVQLILRKKRNCLVVHCTRKRANREKTKNGENLFFKALSDRFLLTLKSCSWFNKVVHDRPSIK